MDIKAQNRSDYLNSNKNVNLQKYMEETQKREDGGLKDIEIRKKTKTMGKHDFLKLLVTQLSHQDPSKPMQDTQFIAQMAQFSSLEQMNNVAQSMDQVRNYQSFNLVDKMVIGREFNSGDQIHGVVKAVFFDQKGNPFLRTTGGVIAMKDVLSVGNNPQANKPAYQQPPTPPSPYPKQSATVNGQVIAPKPAATPDVTKQSTACETQSAETKQVAPNATNQPAAAAASGEKKINNEGSAEYRVIQSLNGPQPVKKEGPIEIQSLPQEPKK